VPDSDLLQTIAEIAITLAGFAGVVAFLGQRARGDWRTVDLFRFNQLLAGSLAALLLSFAPILLFKLGVPEPLAWRASSGLLALYLAVSLAWSAQALRSLPEAERPEIIPWMLNLIIAANISEFVLQVLCAAGIAYSGESAPVLVALVWLLAFSAFQFLRLLRMLHPGEAA
jgi:hypothetical protein